MSKIELININKYYGDNHVLKDLSLTIEDGDFMTLLGPSGCGKTTTLRVISGLERPQGGVMLIDGKEAINAEKAFYLEPSKRGLNLVFQSYALWPHMTVFENIAFGLKIQKLPKAEVEKRVRDALKMMRISENRFPTSTPACALTCAPSSCVCTRTWAPRSSMSPTTRSKLSPCPPASPSSRPVN